MKAMIEVVELCCLKKDIRKEKAKAGRKGAKRKKGSK